MAVPTPTATYNDLTAAGWTASGSPTAALGQHSASNTTYDFDGSNDYVTLDSGAMITTETTASVSFWFKDTPNLTGNDYRHYLSQLASGTSQQFTVRIYSHPSDSVRRQIEVICYDSAASGNGINSRVSTYFDDGEWHHLVFTVTSGDLNIYIDGTEATYAVDSGTLGTGFSSFGSTAAALNVGRRELAGDLTSQAEGIDRINFWANTVLTSGQVTEHYDEEFDAVVVPTADGDWPTITDSADWTEGGAPTAVADTINTGCNKSYSFDGTDDHLDATTNRTLSGTAMTVACWMKWPTTGSGVFPVIQQDRNNGGQFYFGGNHTGNKLTLECYSADAWTNYTTSNTSGDAGLDDGAWHHVVARVDGDAYLLMVDGVAQAETPADSGSGFVSGGGFGGTMQQFSICDGGRHAFYNFPNASVGRVKIWDTTALSEAQANKEYDTEFALVGTDPDCPVVVTSTGGIATAIRSACRTKIRTRIS